MTHVSTYWKKTQQTSIKQAKSNDQDVNISGLDMSRHEFTPCFVEKGDKKLRNRINQLLLKKQLLQLAK